MEAFTAGPQTVEEKQGGIGERGHVADKADHRCSTKQGSSPRTYHVFLQCVILNWFYGLGSYIVKVKLSFSCCSRHTHYTGQRASLCRSETGGRVWHLTTESFPPETLKEFEISCQAFNCFLRRLYNWLGAPSAQVEWDGCCNRRLLTNQPYRHNHTN